MANAFVKINLHIIFHIKSTSITMRSNDLPRIFEYIGGIIRGLDGLPMAIGGTLDHIHILSSLPKNQCIPDFVRTIKSKSSKWIKSLDKYYAKFAWQDGYGAFSVSPSILDTTKKYIYNQAEHHRTHTFEEEYKAFLSAYGIQYDERYLFSD